MPGTFTKVVTKDTTRLYTNHLNILAEGGFMTVADLETNPTEVINYIKMITSYDDDESVRHKRRIILSAIFYVVPNIKGHENLYHKYWAKSCTPLTVRGTNDPWTSAKKYRRIIGIDE